MVGQQKIPILIAEKAQGLIEQLVPPILQIFEKIGIENIGQPNIKLPDVCLIKDEVQKILDLRNKLIDQINAVSKTIDLLSKPITPLNKIITTTEKALDTVKTAETAISLAITVIPPSIPIPGALITGLSQLSKLVNITLPPIITTAKNKTSSISDALDFVNQILFKLLNIFKIIDQYLDKCGKDLLIKTPLVSLNDYLTKVDQDYTKAEQNITSPINEVYQGFILSIVEEPYSPTVNRRRAVAKNSQGIILLQTPLSFTTASQILIAEVKLIIDSNNLKAN